MTITVHYEDVTGGEFRERPLRRVEFIPYNRLPSDACRIRGSTPATEAKGSRWLLKLVGSAARVIARSASRLFSSVSGKGLAALLGKIVRTIKEVPKVKFSHEVRQQGGNPVDARLSTHYDGSVRSGQRLIFAMFELGLLIKQKRFSRAENERLAELLHSRIIEPSTLPLADYKNKAKVDEDSHINPSSSHQAVNHEEKEKANASKLEDHVEQLVNLHENATFGVNINIPEEGFDSPIEIARACKGSKPLKAAPSNLGLQSKRCHRDKASPLSSPFGNKLSNAAVASRSAVCFPAIPADSGNDLMTPKPRGRSALHKVSHCRYCGSFTMTNPRVCFPVIPSDFGNDLMTPKPRGRSALYKLPHPRYCRSFVMTNPRALKRGGSDSDAGCFGDARRVRQKSCLKDLNLSTCAYTSSTSFLVQEYRQDIELKGLKNLDDRVPSASIFHVPPHSTEMARKILQELDKVQLSPQNKSFKKKVINRDASCSKSSLSAFLESSLKIKDNNDSTKLVTV